MERGGKDWTQFDESDWAARQAQFVLLPDETLAGVLTFYGEVASATDELAASFDLDKAWPLPAAPWFPPGKVQTARRTLLHIAGETLQHAGHADIIREGLDGTKSMG